MTPPVTNLKRDFSALILDLDDEPVRPQLTVQRVSQALNALIPNLPDDPGAAKLALAKALQEAGDKPLTLGAAASAALLDSYPDEKDLSATERTDRLLLAMRVHKGGAIEITPEERDKMKRLLGKHWLGSLVAPRAWIMLETEPA